MEKDTLSDDREDFALCVEAESEQRKASQHDLEFALLDKQWDQEDIDSRKEEARPCLTINKLKAFGKQVVNDGRLNPCSVSVKPVGDGATKHTADIQSDLIRNIETQSQAPIVYNTAFEFAVYGGFGYFRVNVDYTHEDAWDQDITLSRIANPFCVYGDYASTEATSIDWNRAYVTDKYTKSAFEARWGKGRETASFDSGSGDYDKNWFEDKLIRVAEVWRREEVPVKLLKLSSGTIVRESDYLGKDAEFYAAQGITVEGDRITKGYKVIQRMISGHDILEENSEWLGKYIPIVPMYGEEVNVNGKRHFISLIRPAKGAQQMYNYHRSAIAESLSLSTKAPWLVAEGQVDDHAAQWATANRVNHPYLTYTPVPNAMPPQRLPFTGVPLGDMQAAMGDSDDMKAIIGMYDASLGQKSNETSGRAIIARKQEGDTATFGFIDNRNRAVEHGGRIILDLIPHVYSAERILRCAQEDGTTYTVPVNQPVAPKQQLEQVRQSQMPPPMAEGPQEGPPEYERVPEDGAEMMTPLQMARLKEITKVFDLTTGKYDVTVTAGPGFSTRREEAATQMMEFIRIYPQSAPLIGDLLAKSLDWPGSEQVAERLKAMLPPQAQGQIPPMVQHLQGLLQQKDAQAKQFIGQLQQQLAACQKELADKRAEQQRAMFDAHTKRMSEVADAAEKGLAVVPNPQNPQAPMMGDYVAMPIQPATGEPQQPPPEVLIEADLKHREYSIKDRELSLKERQVMSAVEAEQVGTAAQKFQQIDMPSALMQQHQESTQAILQALAHVAQAIEQKPAKKTGRAVKQGDGSWVMESLEAPIEPPPTLQ